MVLRVMSTEMHSSLVMALSGTTLISPWHQPLHVTAAAAAAAAAATVRYRWKWLGGLRTFTPDFRPLANCNDSPIVLQQLAGPIALS